MPARLKNIISQLDTIDEVWAELELNQDKYMLEIRWIEDQWYYLFNGYWFWNNGKLIYLDGWHYTYLNHFKFGDQITPEYRDRDRKWFHGIRYCYTTKEVPELNEKGHLIWLDKEIKMLKMKELNRRVCMGYTDPKGRRAGDSSKHLLAQYMETITIFGKNSGIISSSGEHAKLKLFSEILVPMWQQMPFFYKPITDSDENPVASLNFKAKKKQAGSSKIQTQLRSKIDYSTTALSTKYDGGKQYWLLADEGGKTTEADVYERHQQLRECVSQGAGSTIIGFIGMPSTVGEMEGKGGAQYEKVCRDSHFQNRAVSGQTKTGLFTLYISCLEGLEGFVDRYGNSVIDTPTAEQAEFIGKPYGAREHLLSKRQQFLDDNDTEGYNEEVRLQPIYYKECFRTADGDIGFDMKIINERLDELSVIEDELIRVGNFEWVGTPFKSDVKFVDTPKGRWRVSQILHESLSNKKRLVNINGKMHYAPINPKHITCSDPYKQEKVTSGRMSDGGIATFWMRDYSIDPEDLDTTPQLWKSNRFVCTYLNRPGRTSLYYTDVFLQCIYYGSWLYPEVNISEIIEFAEEHNLMGYFMYDIDWKTGKYKNVPGFYSQGEAKQSLFNNVRDYIAIHGYRERHSDFLVQCKDIQSMQEMTDYDLFTACAGCLKGANSRTAVRFSKPDNDKKKKFPYKKRKYK